MTVQIATYNVLKSLPTDATRVAIDAEWYGKYIITTQFTFCDNALNPLLSVVLWDNQFPLPTERPVLNHPLVILEKRQDQTILDFYQFPKEMKIYLYSAYKDITAMFGRKVSHSILTDIDDPSKTSGQIKKLRNITGAFNHNGTAFTIQDCLGMFNSSLEKALESVGIDTAESKALAKGRDKGQMNLWVADNPNSFLKYAVGDTVLLLEAVVLKTKQVNETINESFPDTGLGNYTIDTIKYSSGSLVNDVWLRWFATKYPAMFALLLQQSQSNSNIAWGKLKKMSEKLKVTQDVTTLLKMSKSLKSDGGRQEGSSIVHGMAAGSIRAFGVGISHTGLFGTIVCGGRCIRENPVYDVYNAMMENVIDIDLSSCYGSALRDFMYPIGLPTIWGKDKDDKHTTLGTFLEQYERELVDDLYVIYVSGLLPNSSQDLVHSKYDLNTAKILKKLHAGFDIDQNIGDYDGWAEAVETTHIGGTFLLTTKQLELGVITSDMLRTIRAVAKDYELSDWMNLSVEAAIYYPKSLRKSNDEWVESISKFIGGKTAKKDYRNRAWTTVAIEGFIGNFLDYRKKIKNSIDKRDISKFTDEEQEAIKKENNRKDMLQTGVKLFVNTLYGCLAAPYFEVGNTVLANNITGKARVGVWMISKALLTAQSITDGGIFEAGKVASIQEGKGEHKGRKPGLTELANRGTFLGHRNVRVTELISEKDKKALLFTEGKTEEQIKQDRDKLDKICLDSINSFFKPYGLELPFKIECKYENCGSVATVAASADYIIQKYPELVKKNEDNLLIKTRGARQENHPKKQFMKHLLDNKKYPMPVIEYAFVEQLGLNDFLASPSLYPDDLPGDDVLAETNWKPWKKGFLFATKTDYDKDEKARYKADIIWDKLEDKPYFGIALEMSEKVKETSFDSCWLPNKVNKELFLSVDTMGQTVAENVIILKSSNEILEK